MGKRRLHLPHSLGSAIYCALSTMRYALKNRAENGSVFFNQRGCGGGGNLPGGGGGGNGPGRPGFGGHPRRHGLPGNRMMGKRNISVTFCIRFGSVLRSGNSLCAACANGESVAEHDGGGDHDRVDGRRQLAAGVVRTLDRQEAVDRIHAVGHLAERGIVAVEERCVVIADEEL